jgi:hypothetical protein
MGVKEVLHRTKHLGWGTDTHLYRSAEQFYQEFPARLRAASPRVLKQNRGNAGQGVWKVEEIDPPPGLAAAVRVLHAERGSNADLDFATYLQPRQTVEANGLITRRN